MTKNLKYNMSKTLKDLSIRAFLRELPRDLYPDLADEIINSLPEEEQEDLYFYLRDVLYNGKNELRKEQDYLIIYTNYLKMLREGSIIGLYELFDENLWIEEPQFMEIINVGTNRNTYVKITDKSIKETDLMEHPDYTLIREMLATKIDTYTLDNSIGIKTNNFNNYILSIIIEYLVDEGYCWDIFAIGELSEYFFDTEEGRKYVLVSEHDNSPI